MIGKAKTNRYEFISKFITNNSKVLDIGCSNGELIQYLSATKNIESVGIEIDRDYVNECLEKGLNVLYGDADIDLEFYPDNCFDYSILSHTLQALNKPEATLNQLRRVSKHIIVSFPNFGNYSIINQLIFKGKMPVNKSLPMMWYNTTNIRYCTLLDFKEFCENMGLEICDYILMNKNEKIINYKKINKFSNLITHNAVFMLKSKNV